MTLRRLGIYSAALVISAWVAVPLLLISIAAFTPRDVLYQWPRPLWPEQFTLETMRFFLRFTGVWQSTLNSVFVAVLPIGLAFAIAAPASYALARVRVRGRGSVRWFRVRIVAAKTSFHESTKVKIPAAASPGSAIGRGTRRNAWARLVPRGIAAPPRSQGIAAETPGTR